MAEKVYDLQERTAKYAEAVIELCLKFAETAVSRPLISQLVRAAASIGANYCEADNAETPRDFKHKIALCRKESHETKYWCRMVAKVFPLQKPLILPLWKEAHELNLIFSTIFRKAKLT